MSGNCIGYRVLHKRLIEKHKLSVGRSVHDTFVDHSLCNFCFRNVVMMLSALDNPEGAVARKGKKLSRRVYHSKVR